MCTLRCEITPVQAEAAFQMLGSLPCVKSLDRIDSNGQVFAEVSFHADRAHIYTQHVQARVPGVTDVQHVHRVRLK